jgi:hypothetical protein
MRGKCKQHPVSGMKESGEKRAGQATNLEQKLDVIYHEI